KRDPSQAGGSYRNRHGAGRLSFTRTLAGAILSAIGFREIQQGQLLGGGAAQRRCDLRAGKGRDGSDLAKASGGRSEKLSEFRSQPRSHFGNVGGADSVSVVAVVWRGGRRSADRLRKRRLPAVGARRGAATGGCDPSCARRFAVTDRAAGGG